MRRSTTLDRLGWGSSGATLGAMWLTSEWARYRLFPADPFALNPMERFPRLAEHPEGKGIMAAIWAAG